MSSARRPSPALVVAVAALFVSLAGTAVAATPIVKRALLANNALKLRGRTAAQVAALPSPAASARGLVDVTAAEFRIGAGDSATLAVPCAGGRRAIGGGVSTTGGGRVVASTSYASSEGTWSFELFNLRADGPAVGNVYAICLA